LNPISIIVILSCLKFEIFSNEMFCLICMEAIPLCLLLNKLHVVKHNRFLLIQIVLLHVCYMFRPVRRPSSGISAFIRLILLYLPLYLLISSSIRFLYWHAWWWPKYRPKHVVHMSKHNVNQRSVVFFWISVFYLWIAMYSCVMTLGISASCIICFSLKYFFVKHHRHMEHGNM
jgi:hypothetical protein